MAGLASNDDTFDIITEEEVSESDRYPLPDPKYEIFIFVELFTCGHHAG